MNFEWEQASRWSAAAGLMILLVWEGKAPFFAFARGSEKARHGLLNVAFGLLNATVVGVLFAGLWWMTSAWAEAHSFGLMHWLKVSGPVRWIGAALAFDAWMYFWHRMNHRVAFLWRFHRVHHSDPQMDVTTASRFHFGEIILSSLGRVPVIALIGLRIEELAVYELLAFAVVQFHHANIGLPPGVDRWLRAVIVTPFMHKVHHSRWQPETDSNYSSLLSVWDRFFGSFRLSADPHSLKLGLDDWSAPKHQDLAGMVLTPFKEVEPNSKKGTGEAS